MIRQHHKKTGQWTISVEYDDDDDQAVMAAALESDAWFKFQAQGKSNVKLLTENDATSEQGSNQLDFYVKCAASNGALTVTTGKNSTALGTQYYAVRTNNEWGIEVDATNTTSSITAGDYEQGDAVREGSVGSYTYWVCKLGYTYSSGTASGDATHWQSAKLHSADSIDIVDIADD